MKRSPCSIAPQPTAGFTIHKALHIMKLTTIILMAACLQASANASSQQISIVQQNTTLEKVFKEIHQKTGYQFFYQEELLKQSKRFDINIQNATIEQVLERCFKNQPLTFVITEKTIVIKKKERAAIADLPPPLYALITGKVTDEKGAPLSGVSVSVVGKKGGVTTNESGNFSIEVPENAELSFSYLGYKSVTVSVKGKTSIDINLEPSEATSLNNVVVVGYGTQRKRDRTDASATVEAKQLVSPATGNVGNMLQGQVPGLSVKNNEGVPGGNPIIRIRGASSLQGSNRALIVVDGLQGVDLGTINPGDIQSVEVLKGPSATAIYGSEGSNGVLLVTTKRGRSKAPEVNLVSNVTVSKVNTDAYELMDAGTFARYANLKVMADNLNQTPTPVYTDQQIADFDARGGTDWMSKIFRTGVGTNNSINISGSGQGINYLLSGGYLNQQGTAVKSDFKRYNLRASLDFTITKWLSLNMNWAGTQSDQQNNLRGATTDKLMNPLYNALIYPATAPVYDANGNYTSVRNDRGSPFWSYNPVATATEPINREKTTSNNIFASLIFRPFANHDLSFEIQGGARLREYNYLQYLNLYNFQGESARGRSAITYLSSRFYQNTNILRYNKKFGSHSLNFTGIYELKSNEENSYRLENRNFPTLQTNVNDLASSLTQRTFSNQFESFIRSWVGRVTYNYDDKYLVTASYRADASSVFGTNNKWGSFPAVSGAWRLSEENFLRNKIGFLSDLKLRVGWGITGNQAIAPYQSLSAIGAAASYPLYGNTDIPGYAILRPANPDLKWEETEQTNLGLDASLMGGALGLSVDYYQKKTRNLLMPSELAQFTGIGTIVKNMGAINGRGFEGSVNYNLRSGNFTMNTSFNISRNFIKVVDLGANTQVQYKGGTGGFGANEETVFMFTGERFGVFYLWVDQGTWGSAEAKEALRYGQLPGDTKYRDVNNDGIIDQSDRVRVGHIDPDFEYALNTQMTYKKFGLSFNINAVTGNSILNQERMNTDVLLAENYHRRWTPENQNTNIPAVTDAKTRAALTAGHPLTNNIPYTMFGATTRFLEDGSYLRLRTMQLSYNLAGGVIKNSRIKNFNVYLIGENLLTISNYSGFNPEVSAFTEATRQGYSVVNYPVASSVTLGFNLTF